MNLLPILYLLVIGNGIAAMLFVLYMVFYKVRTKSIQYFAFGSFLQTIAWIIFSINSNNLTESVLLFGNLFQYFGFSLQVYGFTYMKYKKPQKSLYLFLLITFMVYLLYVFYPNISSHKIFISSFFYFLLFGYMFLVLILPKTNTKMQNIVAVFALIFSLIHISRGVHSVMFDAINIISDMNVVKVLTINMYVIVTFTFPLFLLFILKEDDNKNLRELNATKDKLFRIIGHDLKSPIIQLIQFSEIIELTHGEIPPDKLGKLGKTMRESTMRTSKLLDNLLKWAQSQSNSILFEQESINAKINIDESIKLLSINAIEKSVKLINTVDDDLFLFVDLNMYKTIIRNLISNAIKFSFENTDITISARTIGDYAEISVTDSGIGICEIDILKIFKIDEGFTTPGTNNEIGTGLGLILCKEFVEKHNGKISIESELNKGTSISFTVPIKRIP